MENFDMEIDDMMPKTLGSYSIIRSSPDKEVMLGWGWHGPEYDESSQRWFESAGFGYCSERDCGACLEADDIDMDIVRSEHPECPVRESFWDITYGEDNEIPEHMLIVCDEFENGKCHSFTISVDCCSEEDAEELKEKVKRWHVRGSLSIDSPKCTSFSVSSRTIDIYEPRELEPVDEENYEEIDWEDDGESIDDMEELPFD